jgi:two-component system chemotaxis sensor kinase CheA
MEAELSRLVEPANVFPVSGKGNEVHKFFEENQSSKGIVVLDDNRKPVGLIMRNHFYQTIGTQFGFSIYLNRDVSILMKTDILCIDVSLELSQFGYLAMNRNEEDVYDFVIIMDKDEYIGVASISNFLMVMSELKEKEAEQEKKFRKEIEIKNKSIKNLMNNAEQGFLSFGENLVIFEEHSSVCTDLFKQEIAGKDFGEVLTQFMDSKEHALFMGAIESVFAQNKKRKAKTFLKLLPEEFIIDDRYINIKYKIISFKEQKIIMVILTDITDKKALERKTKEEKNNINLLLSAINNKSEIMDAIEDGKKFFSKDAKSIVESNIPSEEMASILFRTVHTMKGDFALRSFHNTALNLHKIEDMFSAFANHPDKLDCGTLSECIAIANFDALIEKDLSIIREYIGESYFETDINISIPVERIDSLLADIEARFDDKDREFLTEKITRLTQPTINSILMGYNEYTQILAIKLNKEIADFVVSGDTVYIEKNKYSDLVKSLIHIFRNIVDHGIESPEDRIEKGKEEQGQILCDITDRNNHFVIRISDDGKGINPEIIREKAIEKNIYTRDNAENLSDSQIINTIFFDSFSTKDSVSMLSGRGVGLAAVKNETYALGGKIIVASRPESGTTFEIQLPL